MRVLFVICAWIFVVFSVHASKLPYEVKINASDSEARTMLQDNLDLITQRVLDDLDQDQIEVLLEDTPDQAQKFLQTLGYFNSQVTVEKDGNDYVINVDLGEPVTINNVEVLIDGAILTDESLPDRYLKAMDGWTLPIGSVFTQNNWSTSKESALRSITAEHYPLAKITASKAEIDPVAKTATLHVTIDSNRFIRFGDITVVGAKRYPETIARNLADFNRGTPYTLAKLLNYQNALEQDGHYSNASAGPRFDQLKAADEYLPLTVTVEEVLRKKFEAGLRYDTEEGPSVSSSYTHYNVFNRGYIGSVAGKFGDYEQSASLGLATPRSAKGYFYTGNIGFENTEWQKLRTKSANTSFWQVRQRGTIEAKLGVEFMQEHSRITDGGEDFGSMQALLLRFGWTQRKLDNMMRPHNGYLVDINLGVTPGSLASSTTFARTGAKAMYYYTPKDTKLGTFVVHGQLSHIFAKDDDKVPKTLLFRTGGANTVRGYEYQSIGIDLPNDAVIGGTSMAMFSLEYQHPITQSISLAVFHDEGAVNNGFGSLKFESSNGFGVRWFSPIAPLSVDIAHADKDNKWRWHLSLGYAF